MLAEPQRTAADLNFVLFGIPVRIHPLFWLMAVLLGPKDSLPFALLWVLAVFISVLVHELGHALTMRCWGHDPWIVLYGMGGLAIPGMGRAHVRPPSRRMDILTCLAGPLAQFMLAAAVIGLALLFHSDAKVSWWGFLGVDFIPVIGGLPNKQLLVFVNLLLFVSVLWPLINLLPIYPLDGGQIARHAFLALDPYNGLRNSLVFSMLVAGAMAVFAAVEWKSIFATILFGYFALGNYLALQGLHDGEQW